MSKVKRLLVGMLIVGAITAATASGTFATFNASTTNNGTVTSGTLLLGNTPNAGSECISSDSGVTNTITQTNSANCGILFTGTLNPTGSTTSYLDLKNEGNFNAGSLALTVSTCVSTQSPITVNGHTFAGDALLHPLCNQLQAVIAEVGATGGSALAGAGCIYGANSGTTPLTNCSYSGSLASAASGPTTLAGGGLAVGAVRHFVVDINFPDTSDNRFQGQNAAVTLTWTLNQ